jgi:hypothetical protein
MNGFIALYSPPVSTSLPVSLHHNQNGCIQIVEQLLEVNVRPMIQPLAALFRVSHKDSSSGAFAAIHAYT